MAIPKEYIQELVAKNDIVDIISSNVQLKNMGRLHKGLCPFHNEKTPSFTVYPETQSFYCFGCGAAGDAVNFIMKIQNLDYIEAVRYLASRSGMQMPDENDETSRLRSKVLQINKLSAQFFYKTLNSEAGKNARGYWRSRGLTDNIINKFGLGYSPNSFYELGNYLKSKGFTEQEILASGVCKKSEKGNVYDVFRNRVMVPIIDVRGNIVAFGGRNLGDEKPKYLNSGETIVYHKRKTLFGLNFAKKTAKDKFILCEGYLDAIALVQAGFDNAIAGCGTALTAEQVKLISNYTQEIVLCYDSDEAGQTAAKKAISLFSSTNMHITVLSLDGAKDPDEFIQKFGKERFETVLSGANNATEYALQNAKAKYNILTPDGVLSYVKNAIDILAENISPTERDVYIGRIANETNISKNAITEELTKKIKQKQRQYTKKEQNNLLKQGVVSRFDDMSYSGGEKVLGIIYAEQQLVSALIKDSSFINDVKQKIKPENFLDDDMKQIYTLIIDNFNQGQAVEISVILPHLTEKATSMLGKIMAQNFDTAFSQKDIDNFTDKILKSVPVSSKVNELTPQQIMDNLKKRGIIN